MYLPELWEQIVERMQRFGRTPTENQKRQAFIPKGAIPIRNPVGTAPAFIVESGGKCVISLPGVPREMEYLAEHEVFPYLRQRYQLRGIIKARVLHTAGMGESVIDEHIGEFEKLANPTVGLAAHYGIVDIRITAKAESEAKPMPAFRKSKPPSRQKLGRVIYGADSETLGPSRSRRWRSADTHSPRSKSARTANWRAAALGGQQRRLPGRANSARARRRPEPAQPCWPKRQASG